MDELQNPYRPGAGTQPPALIGRDSYIGHFGTLMRRALQGMPGKSVMPIGLRGVGKTVLLNRFVEIAQQERLSVAFVEAPETGDLRGMLARSLRKILLQFDAKRASAKALRALRILKSFQVNLPDGSKVTLDFDALVGSGDSGVLADDLTELLVAAGEAAAERDTGILLAIDEVQYLTAEELGAAITAIHRTTQLNLPVVLVGPACRSCRVSLVMRSHTPRDSSNSLPSDHSVQAMHATRSCYRPAPAASSTPTKRSGR